MWPGFSVTKLTIFSISLRGIPVASQTAPRQVKKSQKSGSSCKLEPSLLGLFSACDTAPTYNS